MTWSEDACNQKCRYEQDGFYIILVMSYVSFQLTIVWYFVLWMIVIQTCCT